MFQEALEVAQGAWGDRILRKALAFDLTDAFARNFILLAHFFKVRA